VPADRLYFRHDQTPWRVLGNFWATFVQSATSATNLDDDKVNFLPSFCVILAKIATDEKPSEQRY
jgi:hypothetical protein